MKIMKIEEVPSQEWVYDPVCTAPHTYIAEGVVNHNCVLWIDEIEKSLSGTKSSNFSVSGYENIWYKENGQINYATMHQLHKIVENNPKQQFEVAALNPGSLKLEWKPIVRSLEHQDDRPLIKVKTSSGRTVVASQDHSFVTVDKNGEIIKCKAIDLYGQLVPVAKNIFIETLISEVDLSSYNTPRTWHKLDKLPLNRETGQLIGLWLAEGSVSGDAVQFAASHPSIRELLVRLIRKYFPAKTPIKDDNTISISSRPLSDWIRDNFVCGACEKELPEFILQGPKEFRFGVIEGALAGDGSAQKTSNNSLDLTLSSGSPSLLDGYGMLLSSVGIRYTRTSYKNKTEQHKSNAGGELRICNFQLEGLQIPHREKQDRVDKYRLGKTQTHRPSDRIPIPTELVKKLELSKSNSKHELLRIKSYRGKMSAYKAEEILKEVYPQSDAKTRLYQFIYSDVRWDIVTSIEFVEPEENIYDIEVEDNHTFMLANGLIVHNSDGGTLARVFGTLLTAMEERMKGVVTLATANDIQALPPELIRRFNEVMFVDLPVPSERREIFNIHLRKRGRDAKKLNLDMDELIAKTHLFTGSEIEKVVTEAIARAFHTGKKDVTQENLVGAISSTKVIAKVMKEKIDAIREWARDKARYASSMAEAVAAPGAQKITTSKGKELDLNADLEDIDEVVKTNKQKDKEEDLKQYEGILDD